MSEALRLFETERRRLLGLAYRMLGSLTEAEDALQDAWLRWQGSGQAGVENPAGYLTRIVTRLCLDRLKAARSLRETYVGPWLPEPVAQTEALTPEGASLLASDLSLALLMALERLSPLERAAFLLHDVFDLDYGEIARTLERSEAACRQLAARARGNVQRAQPRFTVAPETGRRIAAAFLKASRDGDLQGLAALLARDAELHTDGGGIKPAALNPIFGQSKVARFFTGLAEKGLYAPAEAARVTTLNGLPAILSLEPGETRQVTLLALEGERIRAVYVVRNPHKLRGLDALWASIRPAG